MNNILDKITDIDYDIIFADEIIIDNISVSIWEKILRHGTVKTIHAAGEWFLVYNLLTKIYKTFPSR